MADADTVHQAYRNLIDFYFVDYLNSMMLTPRVTRMS
jgi:hypothetical protein